MERDREHTRRQASHIRTSEKRQWRPRRKHQCSTAVVEIKHVCGCLLKRRNHLFLIHSLHSHKSIFQVDIFTHLLYNPLRSETIYIIQPVVTVYSNITFCESSSLKTQDVNGLSVTIIHHQNPFYHFLPYFILTILVIFF